MPHIQVETNIWDTDEAVELGCLLGDEDAWRFVLRLWGWGIDADCESGVISLPPKRVASIVVFSGDAVTLFDALVATRWLVPRGDGRWYMRGWSRTRRYFRQKRLTRARMKKYRARQKRDAKGTQDVTRNSAGTFGIDPDPDRDRNRNRDRSRSGESNTDEGLRGHEVLKLIDSELHLTFPPPDTIAKRISVLCPIRRELVVTAIESTKHADMPNWTYLADCLERPMKPRQVKRAGVDYEAATRRATEESNRELDHG